MKKILFIAACILMYATTAVAQRHELRFNADGKFKIVQFTDLHLKLNEPKSDTAYRCIEHVLKAEKPDFVIITGDMIYSAPGDLIFNHLMQFMDKFKIPFAFTFGNHDRQQGLTNAELFRLSQNYKWCVTQDAPGLTGSGNCDIAIKGRDGKDAAIIYCIDSGEDSKLEKQGVKGYDYIHADEIAWYETRSKAHTAAHAGTPLPALAFFHIPFPEYLYAINDPSRIVYGTRREKQSIPLLNSGMFCKMKEMGDVMGVFCGHDHNNDFAVEYFDVLLAYGRFSGGNTEYNDLKPNGARVIQLSEGSRSIVTWIRLSSGQMLQQTSFPQDFH